MWGDNQLHRPVEDGDQRLEEALTLLAQHGIWRGGRRDTIDALRHELERRGWLIETHAMFAEGLHVVGVGKMQADTTEPHLLTTAASSSLLNAFRVVVADAIALEDEDEAASD